MALRVDEDGSGQYQGSQAFSHVLAAQNEFITPNTGSLNFFHPLVNLRGKRSSIALNLSLSYADGMLGTFGLPDNWGFNVAYVLPEKTITISGRTHVIDFTWADSTGYQSGLKYVNDHGTKFQKMDPPLPLPSNRGAEYEYRLQTSDGSTYYFDVYGKLWEQYDLFENHIYYSYAEAEDSDVLNMALDRVEDSWGQVVLFQYEPTPESVYGNIFMTMPDGGKASIFRNEDGVGTVTDPAGLQTTFDYYTGEKRLNEITYPTGLISHFDYIQLQYKRPRHPDQVRYKYAVQDHYRRDMAGNTTYEHTSYSYGDQTGGNTYTGFGIQLTMGGLQDLVMEGGEDTESYVYDVYETKHNEQGHPVSTKYTLFNSLHLPITEERFLLNSQGTFDPAYQSTFDYANNIDFAQTTNYARPKTVKEWHNTSKGATADYKPMKHSEMKYNDFGNLESVQEFLYDTRSNPTPLLRKNTMKSWHTVDLSPECQIQIQSSETVEDKISQSIYQTDYVLSADRRTIGSSTVRFADGSDPARQLKPWKEQSFTFDGNGRLLSETSGWSEGVTVPDGSVPSATITYAYAFANGILTESKTDALRNTTTVNYDVRVWGGPIVSNIMPLGQREEYEYDKNGRVVSHVDALGHKTQTMYSVGANSNTEKITDSINYTRLSVMDGMGRVTMLMDNGDPGQASLEPTRVVSQTGYDNLSRVKERMDILNRKTTYTYDSLNRQLEVRDSDENVVRYKYDDTQLSMTETMNGALRNVSVFNGDSKLAQQVKHPDSSDASTTYKLVMDLEYDGLGRQTSQIFSHAPLQGSQSATMMRRTTTEYNVESAVCAQAITGASGNGADTEHRRYMLDLFGNTHSYAKTTKFSDGRSYSVTGPITCYDASNRLVLVRNQLGQEERNVYNENGLRTVMKRFDGTEISYSYDASGQVIRLASPSSSAEMTYEVFGRLSQVIRNGSMIKYAYSRDGTPISVSYGDGRSQKYTLDQYSRVVKVTDPFGTETSTNFNAQGRASDRQCKGETVSYIYGKAINCNNLLTGLDVKGSQSYHRSLVYDGFGQVSQSTVTDKDSVTLLETLYSRTQWQRLRSVQSTSDLRPELNSTREFLYNGLGQVIQDTTKSSTGSTTKYAYDGNSNVISVDVDGTISKMTYNEIDQRADAGFKYDTNGRMMSDDKGRQYSFSDEDLLLSVQEGPSTKVKFGYHGDESLASHQSENSSSRFFHNFGAINAVETKAKTQTTASSLFADEAHLIAGCDVNKSSAPYYFIGQQGSTALLLEEKKSTSITYKAYGSPMPSAPLSVRSSFGYRQEFTDPVFGLLYLRSRFYSPDQMAFISMDTHRVENRYAYCDGDPINLFDPHGHAPEWLSLIAGIPVGVAVTVLTGGVASGIFGASALTASLVSATVGGALGSLAGGYTHAYISGGHYGGGEAAVDLLSGAVGGLLGGVGGAIGARFASQLGSMAIGALAGSIGSAGVYAAATGHAIGVEDIIFNAVIGFGVGAAGARLGNRAGRAMIEEQVAARQAPAQDAGQAPRQAVLARPVAEQGPGQAPKPGPIVPTGPGQASRPGGALAMPQPFAQAMPQPVAQALPPDLARLRVLAGIARELTF